MNCRNYIHLFFLLLTFPLQAQISSSLNTPTKTYTATRIEIPPVIDGVLNDEAWENIPVAENFVMLEPGDGRPERKTHPTQVKVIYDDEALYVAAYMKDNEPDRILREFTQRDNIGQSDFFLIDINPYNDGENQNRFMVTSAGAIADARMKGEREDFGFNTVWNAATSFGENGWYAEMRIPYSALRFPDREEQVWSVQFIRQIKHLNEVYVWNYINKSVGKATHYNGILRGIHNIDAPIRLSLYPYTSFEADHFEGRTQTNFSAGMDLKYGLTDAFTLDATLVPDFGQTAYDAVELNLGPFEQTFGENRAFFTEGTELFTKGGLFYSRRIGDTPTGFNEAQQAHLENEEVLENPENTDLLNALKISGRTSGGLGIGFFNAITQETRARFRNTLTGETRDVVTEPFANYNIFVLDQQFDQKSSVSLINTNVTRNGHFRDGNVTGFLFDVYTPSSSFNFSGEAKMSYVNIAPQSLTGFASTFSVSRSKGNFRYGISHDFANETYDINDMGVNFTNNFNNFSWNTSYRIFEPSGIFNSYNIQLYGDHQRRYRPDVAVTSNFGTSFFGMTVDRFAFGASANYNTPFKDFFEPRREGSFILYDESAGGEVWISSDYRKKFAVDSRLGFASLLDDPENRLNFRFSPRFRFSNKFTLVYSFRYTDEQERNSFVTLLPRNVIFGRRDQESVENSVTGSYNFNTIQAVNLSFRNFWSSATFAPDEFTRLLPNGSLQPVVYDSSGGNNPNANFNIWNFDLSYQWRFAPGSEAILLYRNSVFRLDDESQLNYVESLERLFDESLRQNISLRIVYYIDYNRVRNLLRS